MKYVLLAAIGLVILAVLVAAGPPAVSFVRPPSYVHEGDMVVLQVRVEPKPTNRLLAVAAVDGDLIVSLTNEELPGENAPRTRWIRWRLPSGDLTLVAVVYGAGGKEAGRDVHKITVIPSL